MIKLFEQGDFSYWLPEDAKGQNINVWVCIGSKFKEKKSAMVRFTASKEMLFSPEKKFSVNSKEEHEIRQTLTERFDRIVEAWESAYGPAKFLEF